METTSHDLIVGNSHCTYVAVCDILNNSASAGALWPKLTDISRTLGVSEGWIGLVTPWLHTETKTHASILNEMLQKWRAIEANNAKLNVLLSALEINNLKECADELRHCFYDGGECSKLSDIKESTTWSGLSKNLKIEIRNKMVKFQENQMKLGDCVGDSNLSKIDSSLLVKLGNNETPTFVNNQVHENLQYYVQRNMMTRNILKKEVLQSNSSDIIMVQGIERMELTRLAEGKETDVTGNQILQRMITVRLMLLECDGDYERICNLTSKAVHWIRFEYDSLLWVKSTRNLELMQQYVNEAQQSFTEIDLLSKTDKIFIISDSPGMGKTMLLANIAKEILKRSPTTLVRYIVLKELVQRLSRKTINIDTIISVIAEQSSDFQFGRNIVERLLKTSACVLMFDGFDEVLLNQVDLAKTVLKEVVRTLHSASVFVTTRPHIRDELENDMHILGYTIQPFKEDDALLFLQSFWNSQGVATNASTYKFAKSILKSLASNMTDIERDIAGIPLQCRLLAEAHMEDAIRYTEVEFQENQDIKLVTSIFEMYGRHINMCFQKFCTDESTIKIDAVKQMLMQLALHTLFPESTYVSRLLTSEPGTRISTYNLCRLGLLEVTRSNEIRFVHRTFAEYLIAWFAVEQAVDEELKRFLISHVFSTKPVISTITTLRRWKDIYIQSFQFNFPVICYFVNEIFKIQYKLCPSSQMLNILLCQNNSHILFASVFHNYLYVLVFASKIFTSFNDSEGVICVKSTENLNILSDLLLITSKYASVDMMKSFCKEIKITDDKFKKPFYGPFCMVTALHVAIHRGYYNLVEYLVNQHKNELFYLQYLLHFCVYGSLSDSNKVISDKKLIIKLLNAKSTQWLEEQCCFTYSPLLQTGVHAELLLCLIQEGADVNVLDINTNSVLHKIAQHYVSPKAFHLIVKALGERDFAHYNTANYPSKLTPLSCAVNSVELLEETLEILSCKGTDFNFTDKSGNTAIFYAIKTQRSVNLLRCLIKYGVNWKQFSLADVDVLHVCVDNAHCDALKYFVECHSLDMNIRNNSLETPLHKAVMKRTPKNDVLQQLLITGGANVKLIGGKFTITPFQQAFELGQGINLSTIKLMEKSGLLITSNIALKALRGALCNRNILPDEEFTNVLEYLSQKLGSHNLRNPWNCVKLKRKMAKIIENTHVTFDSLAHLKRIGLLTDTDIIQISRTTNTYKCTRLYEIVREKPQSLERFSLSLLLTHQTKPFSLLRSAYLKANNCKACKNCLGFRENYFRFLIKLLQFRFTTPPPMELSSSSSDEEQEHLSFQEIRRLVAKPIHEIYRKKSPPRKLENPHNVET